MRGLETKNKVNEEVKKLLQENTMYVMRDKYTKVPLGISFSEEGLRGIAAKTGVYLYCKGRITNYKDAQTAEKSPRVVIERFIPKDYPDNPRLASMEIHWTTFAKRMLTANSNAFYHSH